MVASHPLATIANANPVVILGRSKERSDAAQTLGSMPGLLRAATVQVLLRRTLRLASRHGSSGLRDGASLLLRPWMTKVGRHRPISTVCATSLNGMASVANPGPSI
ncbi:hypothetical protein X746_12300 [Mesorhizobium sp. LNJC380A00]|nr:hypothetical protein X746_12300 [Mesorhizobium sp. LNJC380A00]